MIYNEAFSSFAASSDHTPLLGHPATGYWSNDLPQQAAVYQKVLEQGQSIFRNHVQLPTYGEPVPAGQRWNLYYVPVWSADGDASGILITISPARSQQEVPVVDEASGAPEVVQGALQDSEARLRAAVSAAEVGIWRTDIDAAVIKRDANLCRIMGLPPRDSSWPFADFLSRLHPEDIDHVQKVWNATVNAGAVYDVEYRIIRPDGDVRWIHDRGRLVVDDEGTPLYFAGAAMDITERKKMEQALRDSEERFRLAVRATNDVVWDWDLHDDTVTWSDSISTVFGYPEAQKGTTGDWWLEQVHPDDRERVVAQLQAVVDSHSPRWTAEYRFRRGDNDYAHVLDRGYMIFDHDGNPVRMIGALQDSTERKKAARALRELNETLEARVEKRTRQVRHLKAMLTLAEQRERDRIAQVLHDDLQQLLYALQLRLKMVESDTLEEDREELYQLIERAITTALTLTVDLSPPVLQGEGLDAAIAWLANQMKSLHNLEVTINAEGKVTIPNKDMRVLLFQLVRELLFNVVKHAGTNRAIVTLTQRSDQLLITVEDEGEGFHLARALKDHDVEERYGLFSIRERLALLGGDLQIETAPGQGTRVTIIAPRSE
jgi:PAS domain S-box-containing protein